MKPFNGSNSPGIISYLVSLPSNTTLSSQKSNQIPVPPPHNYLKLNTAVCHIQQFTAVCPIPGFSDRRASWLPPPGCMPTMPLWTHIPSPPSASHLAAGTGTLNVTYITGCKPLGYCWAIVGCSNSPLSMPERMMIGFKQVVGKTYGRQYDILTHCGLVMLWQHRSG